jgi:hypothetical protein
MLLEFGAALAPLQRSDALSACDQGADALWLLGK